MISKRECTHAANTSQILVNCIWKKRGRTFSQYSVDLITLKPKDAIQTTGQQFYSTWSVNRHMSSSQRTEKQNYLHPGYCTFRI